LKWSLDHDDGETENLCMSNPQILSTLSQRSIPHVC
jgi:hypothetical protein